LAQALCVDSSCKTIRPIMAPAMKAKKVAMKAMKGPKAMTKIDLCVSYRFIL